MGKERRKNLREYKRGRRWSLVRGIQYAELFEEGGDFYNMSIQLAELLYEKSNHPKIRGGEFYFASFQNVVVDGELVNALGIFKSENKETFLKVYLKDQNFELGTQEGINIKKE